MDANISGAQLTGIGRDALGSNTTGSASTAVGVSALLANTTGANNVAVGYRAGYYGVNTTTGSQNTLLGSYTRTSAAGSNYQIAIGHGVKCTGENNVTIGRDEGVNRIYNEFSSNATWTRSSDERIKKNIATNTDCGLAFINDLRTVTYKFKAPSEYDATMNAYNAEETEPAFDKKMYGFIAQEVKAAMDTHSITDFAGWHQIDDAAQDNMQGISYEMFVMPLVKAIQELSTKNDALAARITALEA